MTTKICGFCGKIEQVLVDSPEEDSIYICSSCVNEAKEKH